MNRSPKVYLTTEQMIKVLATTDIKPHQFCELIGIDKDRIDDIVSGKIVDSYFVQKWIAYQTLKSSILSFDNTMLQNIVKESFVTNGCIFV
jgi:hypothetical protein